MEDRPATADEPHRPAQLSSEVQIEDTTDLRARDIDGDEQIIIKPFM